MDDYIWTPISWHLFLHGQTDGQGSCALLLCSPQSQFFICLFRDISKTAISSLPTKGLKYLKHLEAKSTWYLKKLPPLNTFVHLETAHLSYPSHCCAFTNWTKKRRLVNPPHTDHPCHIRPWMQSYVNYASSL